MAKRRSNGKGMLRQRKDGRWEGRVVIGYDENGLPKTKNVLAKTKIECAEKLEKLKEEYGTVSTRCTPEMPFGNWLEFWYENFSKPSLRDSTMVCYEGRIYNHIIPSIGKIQLNKLTQNDLQQFYAKLKKSGRKQYVELYGEGVSDRVVRVCHTTCRTALEKAVAEGLIKVNPAIGCKLPPKKVQEMQVLTPDETKRFLIQAKQEGFYEMFLLELSTGMRKGEMLGLKWEDLNFRTGELKIRRQATAARGTIQISTPKTKTSIRTLVLPTAVVEVFREYKKTVSSEWLFPSPLERNQPRHPSSITHILKRLLERANCKQIRFHDLRHTFATRSLESGMDVKTLSSIIGHVSAATTLDIYSHMTDTMQMQAAINIDRNIGGTDAEMPETATPKQNIKTQPAPDFKPLERKIRKSGTGCVYQINDTLWEGSYYPRLPNGKRKKFNVYAKTREECERLLVQMIEQVKAEIAKEKIKQNEGAD